MDAKLKKVGDAAVTAAVTGVIIFGAVVAAVALANTAYQMTRNNGLIAVVASPQTGNQQLPAGHSANQA